MQGSLENIQGPAVHRRRDSSVAYLALSQPVRSVKAKQKIEELFYKFDEERSGQITKEMALAFWGTNFAKVNSNAMFDEVDRDADAFITYLLRRVQSGPFLDVFF